MKQDRVSVDSLLDLSITSVNVFFPELVWHCSYAQTLLSGIVSALTYLSFVFLRLPPNLDLVRSAGDDPRLRYTNDDGDTMLFAVDTNLYGCQDAGAIWFECFKEWITSDTMGFTQATGDACVFVRRNADGFIFVATYVDDTLAAFSSAALKSWFLANFESRFDHSADSGIGQSEFLGITIKSNADRTVHSLNTTD